MKCSCGLLGFSNLMKSIDRLGCAEDRAPGIIYLLKVLSTGSSSVSLSYVAWEVTEKTHHPTSHKSYRKDGTELAWERVWCALWRSPFTVPQDGALGSAVIKYTWPSNTYSLHPALGSAACWPFLQEAGGETRCICTSPCWKVLAGAELIPIACLCCFSSFPAFFLLWPLAPELQ